MAHFFFKKVDTWKVKLVTLKKGYNVSRQVGKICFQVDSRKIDTKLGVK